MSIKDGIAIYAIDGYDKTYLTHIGKIFFFSKNEDKLEYILKK
jgi:hypothetical protein